MKKKVLIATIIIFIIFLVIGIVFAIYGKAIFQRGNPIPYIGKMFILNSENPYQKVFLDEDVYITRNDDYDELISYIEETYDVSLLEQMGYSYFFGSDEKSISASAEIYWKYYLVWQLTIQ
jgi:hypothetical protein